MSDSLVVCGGLIPPKRPPPDTLELDTNRNAPPDKRVFLQFERLTARLLDNPDPLLADAVEIASYVFTADRLIKRGTSRMERMGADWRRKLRFKVPVRRPEVWQQQEVYRALVQTLSFLSEDEYSFEFERGDAATRLEPFFGFNEPQARTIRPDDVILFSGGLDSLAGAVQSFIGGGRTAVLVTHKNSKNVASRQDSLVGSLASKVGKERLFHAPVWVTKGSYEPVEYTQRTRSFLFASLGVAVARMFDRDALQFYENGITSFNLPIAEHVIGTRASRTTHPRVLASFSRLFSLLLQRNIMVENRFLWLTKSDVVNVIQEHGCSDLIAQTTSCANVRSLAMTTKQCGVCSQCIERRFAVLASGLADSESSDSYAVELFTGAHTKAEDLTMVEQYIARAQRLACLSENAFLADYGQVFRALPYIQGPAAQNATKIFELHRRYGRGTIDVVDNQLKAHAGVAQALTLPGTSLLAMINAPLGAAPTFKKPFEMEPPASVQTASNKQPVKDRRIALAIDQKRRRVLFDFGLELKGNDFVLFDRLAECFRSDKANGRPAEQYSFTATKKLLGDLLIEEHTLLQRVRRIRKQLEKHFLTASDYMLDEQDIIQSRRWKGYRLNPYLLLVEPADMRDQ